MRDTAPELWFECCWHCGCLERDGHDDPCAYGWCNDDETKFVPRPGTREEDRR